jgi:hypothetical protein
MIFSTKNVSIYIASNVKWPGKTFAKYVVPVTISATKRIRIPAMIQIKSKIAIITDNPLGTLPFLSIKLTNGLINSAMKMAMIKGYVKVDK